MLCFQVVRRARYYLAFKFEPFLIRVGWRNCDGSVQGLKPLLAGFKQRRVDEIGASCILQTVKYSEVLFNVVGHQQQINSRVDRFNTRRA